MIRQLRQNDIPSVLKLMDLVKDDFAGYKEVEFLESLMQAIAHNEAIIDKRGEDCAGLISFSKLENELTFLAVHPNYRKQGLSKKLINECLAQFEKGEEIHVITFREGDTKGIAARKCYFSCGFEEAETLTVFGYPCQKMTKKVA
ncbi:GNAT family N-acetyltransferase [Anaerorhabdus sp.]|uniref:GNAT family N-acetyltransferase n=1 Tax=Anaerorhabdus sp. TaxID=1872524 RepID=UPI002FC67117